MSTGDGGQTMGDMSNPSEEEERQMREEYDKVQVKSADKSQGGKSLHLNDNGEPLCNHVRGDTMEKPFNVFPPGYFEVCGRCAAMWRKDNG